MYAFLLFRNCVYCLDILLSVKIVELFSFLVSDNTIHHEKLSAEVGYHSCTLLFTVMDHGCGFSTLHGNLLQGILFLNMIHRNVSCNVVRGTSFIAIVQNTLEMQNENNFGEGA